MNQGLAVKYCVDVAEEPGCPECCTSCHLEDELGVGELIDVYLDPKDSHSCTHTVCCTLYKFLQEKR